MNRRIFWVTLFLSILIAPPGLRAQTPSIQLQNDFITGLSLPVFLTNAGDGSKRLFIVQQRGIIKVVQPGSTNPTDFLNISSVVSSSGFERGLLGLAFHPQYASNGRFFVYYTRQSDGAIEIAEYAVSSGDPNLANPNPVRIIITIPHPTFANHNGGTIAFGPDGLLYAATGDGGSGNDPNNNAQNINSLLGKFLRLDINTPVGQVPAYNIPPTNPFAGATPGADEIYAIGLRNPYRFSFDRGGTRTLWVGDVGQDAIEEVDNISLGGNYGWRVFEGTRCTNNDPGLCNPANFIPPVFEYSSAGPDRCSVTGGYVYRGARNALPIGSYIYGDYCSGEILLWHNNQQFVLTDTSRNISSFGEDEDGELYVVGHGGTVDRILRRANGRASSDFDGDGMTDLAVFRPSDGNWYIRNSGGGLVIQRFGTNGDIPAAEDFDGDGRTDIAVFRPSTAEWFYRGSSDSSFNVIVHGPIGSIPVAGNYLGRTRAQLATFTPATGEWRIRSLEASMDQTTRIWGTAGDIPVPGDYDGDGDTDLAVWRPANGTWYVRDFDTNPSITITQFGEPNDIPTPGDFNGDGKNDFAVFRPSTGQWFLRLSNGGFQITQWGVAGDVPVVGDYDGDGRDDIALFRPSNGIWYSVGSLSGIMQFAPWGIANDLPIPKYDFP